METQTTNNEISDFISEFIKQIIHLTIQPKVDEEVGIIISSYKKQKVKETRALIRRNCLRKMFDKKVPTNDARSISSKMRKICKKKKKKN